MNRLLLFTVCLLYLLVPLTVSGNSSCIVMSGNTSTSDAAECLEVQSHTFDQGPANSANEFLAFQIQANSDFSLCAIVFPTLARHASELPSTWTVTIRSNDAGPNPDQPTDDLGGGNAGTGVMGTSDGINKDDIPTTLDTPVRFDFSVAVPLETDGLYWAVVQKNADSGYNITYDSGEYASEPNIVYKCADIPTTTYCDAWTNNSTTQTVLHELWGQ